MIIAGAGGHAKEILTELQWAGFTDQIFLFDNTNRTSHTQFGFPILTREKEVKECLRTDKRILVAVGQPMIRRKLFDLFVGWGATPVSHISKHAMIGAYEVMLGEGLNIMAGVLITANVSIGTGTLVNAKASVHHDVIVGDFCELGPGCQILGAAKIGQYTSVGAGAIILPGKNIGEHCIIAAGAVITHDVPDGALVKGVPGRW